MRKHASIFTAVTISKQFSWDLAETSPSALVCRWIKWPIRGHRLHQMVSVTPSHHRDPITNTCSPLKLVPTRGIPVTGFNHRISQWSAWRCKTCCVAQCPGGRPRHRPPRWQCTRQTTWNSSPYPACQAPPPQPLGELHPAGAAVLQGWSPRWGSSAGSPAADGNPCLLARACDP